MSVAMLVATGWPERVARRRDEAGRFATVGGRGVAVDRRDPLAHAEWLAVAAVDDTGREGRVLLAAPLLDDEVAEIRRGATSELLVAWDDTAGAVRSVRRETLGALVLAEHPVAAPSRGAIQAALLDGIRQRGVDCLPWSEAATTLRQRLAFVHHADPSWPDASDAALAATLEAWLLPFLANERRLEAIKPDRLLDALRALVGWQRLAALDTLAPERVALPAGRSARIDYADPASPVLAVKLQDAFGLRETPTVLGGKVPVTMHLLSPARRPVQVTRDLASFWKGGYHDVRKDLRGRYPKHEWPEDPSRGS
jgi:ATP-dependent helicase HrpB